MTFNFHAYIRFCVTQVNENKSTAVIEGFDITFLKISKLCYSMQSLVIASSETCNYRTICSAEY